MWTLLVAVVSATLAWLASAALARQKAVSDAASRVLASLGLVGAHLNALETSALHGLPTGELADKLAGSITNEALPALATARRLVFTGAADEAAAILQHRLTLTLEFMLFGAHNQHADGLLPRMEVVCRHAAQSRRPLISAVERARQRLGSRR